ncbi:MAG: SpoIIE family protein phosphatase [Holophagales bacterium]|nr:SpoIIE family protein phosphatase [Holophagales bacterium]MYD21410.1 SpoIIE family protein phosphatase [Holophagales bacterium]MYI32664.1 SpoIIE family protein phosphatase [Holophagales bacterium]
MQPHSDDREDLPHHGSGAVLQHLSRRTGGGDRASGRGFVTSPAAGAAQASESTSAAGTGLGAELWRLAAEAETAEWESGAAQTRLVSHWCRSQGLAGAQIYHRDGGPVAAWGVLGTRERSLEHGLILYYAATDDTARDEEGAGGQGNRPEEHDLAGVLAIGLRLRELADELKDRKFQDNYNVVTLEAVYDVGLAITSTLNLDELTEEILLRAVSLLDARRGAFYLLDEEDRLSLAGTIGGGAREAIDVPSAGFDEAGIEALATGVMPDAEHSLAVPIEGDGGSGSVGLLVVADKESRTGVGPFVASDHRALSLFANQAAIALTNAKLHRQALEKERLEREVELAAEIQRNILPAEMPSVGCFETVGWSRPSRQVGGDYYGSLRFAGSRRGLVVADVTGKGMPAALLVSTLDSALRLLVDDCRLGGAAVGAELSPELFDRLNKHIVESSASNRFITLILTEIDPRNRAVRYLNAGHNPGLLVRGNGEVTPLLASGLPLGLLPTASYRVEPLEMGPGDLLCLYSDGITECESLDGEEYGQERLEDFLSLRRERPLSEIVDAIDADVRRFGAGLPQGDDQTVVLIRCG